MNLRITYPSWVEAVRAIVTQLLNAPDFASGLSVGSGATVTKVLSGTAALDFGAISANATAVLTMTVTGAATGDTVMLAAPSGLDNDLLFNGVVTSADTVQVRLHNSKGTSYDPASATWRATVIRLA